MGGRDSSVSDLATGGIESAVAGLGGVLNVTDGPRFAGGVAGDVTSLLSPRTGAERAALMGEANACSVSRFSDKAEGGLTGVLEIGLIRSPFVLVTTAGLVEGADEGTSSPAIALKRLGSGAFGSSVYSGRGKKFPVGSALACSWFFSSSVWNRCR